MGVGAAVGVRIGEADGKMVGDFDEKDAVVGIIVVSNLRFSY